MEFTLIYDGPLKANGSPKDKQTIRRTIHHQFKALWQQTPLNSYHDNLTRNPSGKKVSILREIGNFTFAPLVNTEFRIVAELNIKFLRPEAPGSVITQGGDIDNRLKTLFDALRMPKVESEIPSGDYPHSDENPFFCLLEDDNLITSVSVKTGRLLKIAEIPSKVHLFIDVKTKPVVATWDNIGLV
jgi:hypothetical protein